MTAEKWVLEIYRWHSLISRLEFDGVPALRTATVENRGRRFIVRALRARQPQTDSAAGSESAGLRYRGRASGLAQALRMRGPTQNTATAQPACPGLMTARHRSRPAPSPPLKIKSAGPSPIWSSCCCGRANGLTAFAGLRRGAAKGNDPRYRMRRLYEGRPACTLVFKRPAD
jgi:hypothetical protein